MAVVDGLEFNFDDAQDARTYLGEIRKLWAAWLVGLAALFLTTAIVVLVAGVAVIVVLLLLARPLQRRAEMVVPKDTVIPATRRGRFVSRGTHRDKVLRALVYGEGPISDAVEMAGATRLWLVGRRLLLAVTFVALFGVLFEFGN